MNLKSVCEEKVSFDRNPNEHYFFVLLDLRSVEYDPR